LQPEAGDRVTQPATRRRDKLAPDPGVRRAILTAASTSVREQGVRGLSIAAVLERAQLSTRAFYRHFDSKDQLVGAVFLEMARAEVRRLRRKMGQLSMEAQSQMFASPGLIQPAYAYILEPLIDQLRRGLDDGAFHGIDPTSTARSIQGVVWACTEQHWATSDCERSDVRRTAFQFCLRGLGVAPDTIARLARHD
jgi:AcrR family transcriptional regulator